MKESSLILWVVYGVLMLGGNIILATFVTPDTVWMIPTYVVTVTVLFVLIGFVKWRQ